jgi:galactitol-specific phosphotransferase system IIB component
VVDTTVTADGEVKTVVSTKGEPGEDSVNAGIPWAVERCRYATFGAYAKAVDILVSSDVAVDTIHEALSGSLPPQTD